MARPISKWKRPYGFVATSVYMSFTLDSRAVRSTVVAVMAASFVRNEEMVGAAVISVRLPRDPAARETQPPAILEPLRAGAARGGPAIAGSRPHGPRRRSTGHGSRRRIPSFSEVAGGGAEVPRPEPKSRLRCDPRGIRSGVGYRARLSREI